MIFRYLRKDGVTGRRGDGEIFRLAQKKKGEEDFTRIL